MLNDQRHVIFSQRKDAMNSNSIFEYSDQFLKEIIDELIRLKILKSSNPSKNDFDNKLRTVLGKNTDQEEFKNILSLEEYKLREKITEKFKNARIERSKLLGENQSKDIEKRIFLQSIDLNWKSHIQYLEQLRQVIGLRSYGQRYPLVEYKKEAFSLFENLLSKLKFDLTTILLNLTIIEKKDEKENIKKNTNNINNPKCLLILNKGEKISRNDICEATGKKYKHCCGRF